MAKKLTVPAVVTIYSPSGKAEPHTRANARDLINGAGYTWTKKKRDGATPAAIAPFAIPQNTKFAKSKAQEIIDRAGATSADDDDDGEEVFEGIDDGADNGPISFPEDDDDDDEDEGEEEAPVVVRKPRKPRQKPTPAPEQEEVEGIEEE